MEDDFDLEIIRLRNLLDDSILKVEKENLEQIRRGCTNQNTPLSADSTARNKQAFPNKNLVSKVIVQTPTNSTKTAIRSSCPHVILSKCSKHDDFEKSSSDIHSNIHFLNSLQSSLSCTDFKRKHLLNDARNKYFPCAVPLSPPIRIKSDKAHANICSSNRESLPVKYNCPGTLSERKLVIQNLPNISIPGTEGYASSTCEENIPQSTSLISLSKGGGFSKSFASYEPRIKYGNHDSEVKHGDFKEISSFRSFENNSLPDKKRVKIFPPQENVTKSCQATNLPKDNDENKGLNLHISLDSDSAKDVINKFLGKIPEFTNKAEMPVNNFPHSDIHSAKQNKNEDQHQLLEDVHLRKHFNFEKRNQNATTFTQTEYYNPEKLYVQRHELQHLVNEIVFNTLSSMQSAPLVSSDVNKISSVKVDSGIQSEIENDVACNENFKVEFSVKGTLLEDGNNFSSQEKCGISKGIQVDVASVHIQSTEELGSDKSCAKLEVYNCDKNYDDKHSDFSRETPSENFPEIFSDDFEKDDSSLQKAYSPQEANKVEMMLEKIYEHILQEKEVSKQSTDVSQNNYMVTRDVAVQFNPLHTSTKSTYTSEIKVVDSSCQYDILPEDNIVRKSNIDVSVQVTDETEQISAILNEQVHASTQCEQKTFVNSCIQTEIQANSEHSATSVSSTPVSDSMFMDDLLSEGEVPLPWNLRLLSLYDKGGGLNINNADSSDTSQKEKDYSLSEGEINPNADYHLTMNYHQFTDENDIQQACSARFGGDCSSKNQNISSNNPYKHECECFLSNRSGHLQTSHSSLSEGELASNVSLSLGEVDLRMQCSEFSHQFNNCSQSYGQLSPSEHKLLGDVSLHSNADNSNVSEGEIIEEINRNANPSENQQRCPLQTVVEEAHSVSD